jgi:hypothetical protein
MYCRDTVGCDTGHLNDWEECLQTWKQARIHHVGKVETFNSVSNYNCHLSTTQCHKYAITKLSLLLLIIARFTLLTDYLKGKI